MEPSIFTRIIRGEIPCHKIYEDDQVLAFLDIEPVSKGQALVIPKKQVDHLWDLDDTSYAHLLEVARKVAQRQREVLQPKRVLMVVEGFEVPHAHIKLIPAQQLDPEMLHHKIPTPTPEELASVAKLLTF